MTDQPTGTVTFLFSDIEGSTRMVQKLGRERYAKALDLHRRLLREAFQRHDGYEVDCEGDSFFIAFSRAEDAVLAAQEAQRALADGDWPRDDPFRVRIGIHTGEPLAAPPKYVGVDVHRAARIMAAGHGGQVLMSQTTYALVGDVLVRDLGEHRLKDLLSQERLYQVGTAEFPPLKSLNQTNLPVQPTGFVGRERQLAQVLELVKSNRIVTLTGPGGSGKTRLALQSAAELADDYPDGVWFVSLAAVAEPQLVESTIAQEVGARGGLHDFLKEKDLLLLLDNLEQLLPDVASTVASLGVRILATSRERLNLSGEQEYEVPTLPLDQAITLFSQRARQLRPDFRPDEHVAAIARRLDGLPLALELAAALTKVLTPKQIVERLERSLELLTGGTRDVPERQRTLRATIEWSYGLLAPEEQRLFAALAVFAGSFDLEAAETVTGGDLQTIAALVDKSLLRHTGEGRFFMLETIRDYAAERLEQSGLAEELRRRHADWVMALALAAREELRGDRQIAFLDRLSAEHANIRAALAFAISSRDAQTALTIGGSLGRFWVHRGHDPEGYRWLQAALALPQAVHDEPRWRALYWTAILADGLADENTAMAVSESALALARELDDAEAICASALELERKLTDEGDFQRAEALLEEAAARAAQEGLERTAALVAYQRGRRRLSAGELAAAAPDMETALDKMRQVGDLQAVVSIMAHLAFVEAACGRHAEGRELLRESLALSVDMRHALQIALCLEVSATLALEGGDSFGAAALLIRADGLLDSVGVGQPFGHVETELYYRRPWREVRAHLDDAKIESLRARTPLGDYDEAVAYANQYLAG